MKKVLFLIFLLLLMGLGAANIKAQVRIGGSGAPNAAAVLDLNADDSAIPAGNKGALALPRVSLASTIAQLNGATPITGMLVYNTNATLGTGIYFWNGAQWVMLSADKQYPEGPVAALVFLLDTTVIMNLPATPAYTSFTSPRSRLGDLCVDASLVGDFIADNGRIVVQSWGPYETTGTHVRVVCYRVWH